MNTGDRTYEEAIKDKLEELKPAIEALKIIADHNDISIQETLDDIIKATNSGKKVRIELRPYQGKEVFNVTDDGNTVTIEIRQKSEEEQ